MKYYCDEAATTRVDPDIAKAVYDSMKYFGNPSSTYYDAGKVSKTILNNAQSAMRLFLGSHNNNDKIIFTSGASEANNLALTGFFKANKDTCVITDPIEHHSVLRQPCVDAKIPVDSYGRIDLNILERLVDVMSLCRDNVLVSTQAANSEIGTIQNLNRISQIVKKHDNCYLHVDATQYFYGMKEILDKCDIDMLSCSFHKVHCPKGVGALYVKDGIKLSPIIYGGDQYDGLRGGTECIPLISCIPMAIDKINKDCYTDDFNFQRVYDATRLIANKLLQIPDSRLNGPEFMGAGQDYDFKFAERVFNNISISFKGCDSQSLLVALNADGIAAAAGSACNTNSVGREPSYVLQAIHVPEDYIWGTLRLTISPEITSLGAVDYICNSIKKHVETIRDLNNKYNLKENAD